MTKSNPYTIYKNQDLETSNNFEIVGRLFGTASIRLRTAVTAIHEKRLDKANADILRAELIIKTLDDSLDLNYPIAGQLRSLYQYASRRLFEANMKKDTQILQEISDMMVELRNAWNQALKNNIEALSLKKEVG